jgi:ubiquinone/menaquinone biosynthesis C-methylase UbiE
MAIEDSVRQVATAWKDSVYYKGAEEWTPIFWNEGTVFRSMFDELDLTNVIELAAGHGRHTEQIAERCGHATLMDIHQENIDACRARLGHHPRIDFILNNGYNFQPLGDDTVSAIFCYDAMVHFNPDVVESYLLDTHRVLHKGGKALYHHSNYTAPGSVYSNNPHGRNHMPEELFVSLCEKAGLDILESKSIHWGTFEKMDRVSLVQKI